MRGIAAKNGYDWCIPSKTALQHKDNYGLFETFKMTNVGPKNLGFVQGDYVQENDHCFLPDFFDKLPDNVSLDGYFQTEKYFLTLQMRSMKISHLEDYLDPCTEFISSLDGSYFSAYSSVR